MQAHAIGVPTLAKRMHEALPHRPEIVTKTLQRFLAGRKVNDQMLAYCDQFAAKLPHRPTLWHTVGDALFAIFKQEIPATATFEPDMTLSRASSSHFALISHKTERGPADGVLAALSPDTYIAITRERLRLTPHVLLVTPQDEEGRIVPGEYTW